MQYKNNEYIWYILFQDPILFFKIEWQIHYELQKD